MARADLHPGTLRGRITAATHEVGGRSFIEEVLPVDSVEEYFEHFGALEIDYTFYRPLLDEHLHPTETFHLVRTYAGHLKEGDRLILKAPQAVVAPRLRRGGGFAANPDYLDADYFTHRFYAPAAKLLKAHLGGILFEQEYRRAAERDAPEDEAADLERFFRRIPADRRYHLELRTERLPAAPIFDVLARTGVGQALSHWTWLPPLAEQFERAGGRFFNEGGEVLIRLMTPHGVRYEDAFARAHPFDRLVDGDALRADARRGRGDHAGRDRGRAPRHRDREQPRRRQRAAGRRAPRGAFPTAAGRDAGRLTRRPPRLLQGHGLPVGGHPSPASRSGRRGAPRTRSPTPARRGSRRPGAGRA